MMDVLARQKQQVMERFGITEEYINTMLILTKQRLGILSGIKDTGIGARLLAAIIAVGGTRKIKIDVDDTEQLMLMVDLAAWEYGTLNNPGAMPIDLRYRLNNIFLKNGTCENDI